MDCLNCGSDRCHHYSGHPIEPTIAEERYGDPPTCKVFIPYHPPNIIECICGHQVLRDYLGRKENWLDRTVHQCKGPRAVKPIMPTRMIAEI